MCAKYYIKIYAASFLYPKATTKWYSKKKCHENDKKNENIYSLWINDTHLNKRKETFII